MEFSGWTGIRQARAMARDGSVIPQKYKTHEYSIVLLSGNNFPFCACFLS
jgi:hypothetical protein